MIEIDPGRFLHLFFFVDGTDEFLNRRIQRYQRGAKRLVFRPRLQPATGLGNGRKESGFLGGITMLVTCGYGRAVTATLTRELPTNWRLESPRRLRSNPL